MAISWNIDELRETVISQMAEANRLDEVIDELAARAEAAEAEVARLRSLLALARQYVDDANFTGAYSGATPSGDTVLRRIDAALTANSD